MPLKLAATGLGVDRGGRAVLRDLSLEVHGGEAILLTGPNGSGKTTLIRTIAGFITPVAGAVTLEGGYEDAAVAEHCHYVGHANAIKASLTVMENALFWTRFMGGETERIAPALERLNLAALSDIPSGYLSAGQKRRLGLARLLLAERPIWLLDEPSVSLDAASTAILAEIVDEHVSRGGIAIAATHLPLGLARTREHKLGQIQVAAA